MHGQHINLLPFDIYEKVSKKYFLPIIAEWGRRKKVSVCGIELDSPLL